MSLYAFATNPGARIPPTAGEKASGFVPSTPAASKKLNDVLYELTTFALAFQTTFLEEHNADGTHSDITADLIECNTLIAQSSVSTQIGIFTDEIRSDAYLFANNGTLEDEPIAVHSFIVQGGALSDDPDNGSVIEASFGGNRVMAINLTGGAGESCIIPFYVPGNVDLERFNFMFSSADNYNIDWELLEFDWSTITWGPIEGGPVTGNVSGPIGFAEKIMALLEFPDTNSPNTAGHGVRIELSGEAGIPGQKYLGLKLKSNGDISVVIYQFSYLYWVNSVARAIQR